MLYWSPGRLAFGRAQYAANPFTPWDPVSQVVAALLTSDTNQAATWGHAGTQSALAVTLDLSHPQDAEDTYRAGGGWVLCVFNWGWQWMNSSQKYQVIQTWLNTDPTVGYVRFYMSWAWQLNDPAGNYFCGCTANEYYAAIYGQRYGQDVNDIMTDSTQTRQSQQFIPYVAQAYKGASPEGGGYGKVQYSYPLYGWLDNPGAWDPATSQWLQDAVHTLAYWILPQPTVQPYGDPYLQVWPSSDDETPFADATRYNYLVDYLYAAMEMCYGYAAAGHARQIIEDRYGGLATASVALKYGVQPVAPRALSDLPLDRDCGCWYFITQSGPGERGTRAFLQLNTGGSYTHNHADVGSFQIAFPNPSDPATFLWGVVECTGYSNSFADCQADSAEPHNLISFWNQRSPYNGYGPLKAYFSRGWPTRRYQFSTAIAAGIAIDATDQYRTNAQQPDEDRSWIQTVIREYVYLRELDVFLVVDRLATDGSLQLIRHHINGIVQQSLNADGSWTLNGPMKVKTLWPQTANAPVYGNPTVNFGALLGAIPAGSYTPVQTQMTTDATRWRLDICTGDLMLVHAYCPSGLPATLSITSGWLVTASNGTLTRTVQFSPPGLTANQPVVS